MKGSQCLPGRFSEVWAVIVTSASFILCVFFTYHQVCLQQGLNKYLLNNQKHTRLGLDNHLPFGAWHS